MELQRDYYRYILGLAIFLLSFGVYMSTLCPTVSGLDSGELISVCYTLGIAHPAGYPLYTLLGKLFTLLPIRTVAFRVNMMSAFFASLTAALIYFVVLKAIEQGRKPESQKARKPDSQPSGVPVSRYVAATSAGLLFAFSRAFWSYAVVTEVYTMKAFFLVLLILILLTWRATHPSAKKNRLLWIGAFIYGLSLGTRMTILLFGPAFLLYILIARDRAGSKQMRKWAVMVLFFLLGSSIYLYLPIRSMSDPAIDWGNPETWDNFLAHVTGKQFRFMLFNVTKPMLWAHVKEYMYSFATQFTLLLYPIAIIGAARFLRNRLNEFALLAGICLTDIVFNLLLYTGIYWLEHFFISSFVVFSIWMGWGMKSIMDWIDLRLKTGVLCLVSPVLCLLSALAPILPYRANHDRVDQSQNWDSYDYGKNLFDFVEDNAVIVANSIEPTFALWYFQYVEKKRPDVTVVDANLLGSQWFYRYLWDRSLEAARIPYDGDTHGSYEGWLSAMVMDFTSRNVASRPFYFTFKAPDISVETAALGYTLTPRFYAMPTGPLYQLENQQPEVAVAEPSAIAIQRTANTRFSNSIVFLGYDATTVNKGVIRKGETLHLTYYWKLLDDISDDLTVDILFTDAAGNYAMRHGIPRFHHIHELAYDLPLADICEPGQIIKEEYGLVVPSDITPGIYYVQVGVCKEKGFLKIDGGEANRNFAEVGTISIL